MAVRARRPFRVGDLFPKRVCPHGHGHGHGHGDACSCSHHARFTALSASASLQTRLSQRGLSQAVHPGSPGHTGSAQDTRNKAPNLVLVSPFLLLLLAACSCSRPAASLCMHHEDAAQRPTLAPAKPRKASTSQPALSLPRPALSSSKSIPARHSLVMGARAGRWPVSRASRAGRGRGRGRGRGSGRAGLGIRGQCCLM